MHGEHVGQDVYRVVLECVEALAVRLRLSLTKVHIFDKVAKQVESDHRDKDLVVELDVGWNGEVDDR